MGAGNFHLVAGIISSIIIWAAVVYLVVSMSEPYGLTPDKIPLRGLKEGWFMGRAVDCSDMQWRDWRKNLPSLTLGMAAFLIGSKIVKTLFKTSKKVPQHAMGKENGNPYINEGDHSRISPLVYYYFVFIVIFLYVLHRNTFIYPILIAVISFSISSYFKASKWNPEGSSDYTKRVMTSVPESFYSFKYFFIYVFYVPFYLAGPITTFNSFISHLGISQQTYSKKEILLKAIWMFGITILIDIFLHYIYVYSFNITGHWKDLVYAYQIAVLGFWTLQFMFLKFLVIWRFFRITGLIDGVEAPENMHRCMNNNDTFTGFWRSWHASFNKWIVRYIYVPLGGSKTQKQTLLPIFLFIGLWHDLWMRWVAWAMLNAFFFTIEILIMTSWHKSSFWRPIKEAWWCDYMLGVAGAWNSIFILITNLAINYGFSDIFTFIQYAFLGYKEGFMYVIFWVTVFFSFTSLLDYKLRDIERTLHIGQKF